MNTFNIQSISDAFDRLKEIVRDYIGEIISEYVPLTEHGRNLHGDCPVCKTEKSFTVSPSKGMWYCFGCSRGGDGMEFLQVMPHGKNMGDVHNEILSKYASQNNDSN